MSKTRCLHHIVFCTKRREMTIAESHKKELYAYIYGLIKNKNCFLHRINGIGNHIHILLDLHPSIALADLVKDIKNSSNQWMKYNDNFKNFKSWGEGYYAFSIGLSEKDNCIKYIINQENHHLKKDLLEEMEDFSKSYGVDWHHKDWE